MIVTGKQSTPEPTVEEPSWLEGTGVGRDATILYLRETGQLDTTEKTTIEVVDFFLDMDSLADVYYDTSHYLIDKTYIEGIYIGRISIMHHLYTTGQLDQYTWVYSNPERFRSIVDSVGIIYKEQRELVEQERLEVARQDSILRATQRKVQREKTWNFVKSLIL